MNDEQVIEMRNKILKGIELAHRRLVLQKQKEDGELVFSRNGKIVTVKARDIKI